MRSKSDLAYDSLTLGSEPAKSPKQRAKSIKHEV